MTSVDIVTAMPARTEPTARRAKTRRRLIEAATEVVAEHGFHAATVDRIAERAELSVGALYSNFSGKDELLFAVFDGHLAWFAERLQTIAGSAEPATALVEWIETLAARPDQFHVFIEFWAYAVRKPEVRDQFASRMDQMRGDVAAAIERRASAAGVELPLRAELIALLALALGRGLALEKLARSAAVPEKEIAALFGSLLPG
jgi:AcrR family transcriptional regulator